MIFFMYPVCSDIGKFIERSKSYSVNDKFKHIKVDILSIRAVNRRVDAGKSIFRQFSDKLIDLVYTIMSHVMIGKR